MDALKCSLGYVYKIRLSLMEPVKLVRNIKVSATVMRIPDELGITSNLSDIRDAAGDFVDEFVKAWKGRPILRNRGLAQNACYSARRRHFASPKISQRHPN